MTTKKRNPFLAAFLSLVVAGLGQIYNGQIGRGLIFWLLSLISGMTIFIRFPKSYEEFIFLQGAKVILAAVIIINAFWVARSKKEVQLRSYNRWYYYLLGLIIHVVISFLISSYTLTAVSYSINTIQSPAMEPTIFLGDRFVINSEAYNNQHKPQRGDVVLLRYPQAEGLSVGRIIGRPGEKIEGKNGVVYINNVAIKEPYVKLRGEDTFGPITLEPYMYFIMGDNRAFSFDSRNTGPVGISQIRGKYLYRIKFLGSNE